MLQPVLRCQLQADAVAPRELPWHAGAPGVIDRTDGVYDVLPVARRKGLVSGLFAATILMIGFFFLFVCPTRTGEGGGLGMVLTLEGCSPRSCEPRLSGNHLGCGLVHHDGR